MTRWSEDNSIDKSFFNLRQIKAYTVINFHKWLKLLKPLALDSADWTQFWACPIISYVTLWLWMYCLTFLSLFHHLEHKDNTSAYIIGLLWRWSNIMESLTKPGREEALNIASCYLFRLKKKCFNTIHKVESSELNLQNNTGKGIQSLRSTLNRSCSPTGIFPALFPFVPFPHLL